MSMFYAFSSAFALIALYTHNVRKLNIRNKIKDTNSPQDKPEPLQLLNINEIDIRGIERDWNWSKVRYLTSINGQKYTEVPQIYNKNILLHITGVWFHPRNETGI